MPLLSRILPVLVVCVAAPGILQPQLAAAADAPLHLARVAPGEKADTSLDTTDISPMQDALKFGATAGNQILLNLLGPHEGLTQASKNAAMTTYNAEKNAEAVPLLLWAHVLDPADTDLLRRLGFALKSTGRYEYAHDALVLALKREPQDFNAWWWLGDVQRLLGDYASSVMSMQNAVKYAPSDRKAELSDYVMYSESLISPDKTWENCSAHASFAQRHEGNRRPRRTILEFSSALEHAPEAGDSDSEGLARLGWLNSRLAYSYAYLKEFEPAALYFKHAVSHYGRSKSPVDVVQNLNAWADALELLAEVTPASRDALLDESIQHREEALDIIKNENNPDQRRHTLGRFLYTLAMRFPVSEPRLIEIREQAAKELPWRGPINEFSVASIAIGEAACRMREKDFAGARIVIEMVMTYLDQSLFLEDTERQARLNGWLAGIYNEQGHFEKSVEAGIAGLKTIDRVRTYVPGDVFLRTTAPVSLRAISCELFRSALGQGQQNEAFARMEEYKARSLRGALGSKIADEGHLVDWAAEKAMIQIRLPQFEAEAAAARDQGEPEQTQRLESVISRDHMRLDWMASRPASAASSHLRYVPPPACSLEDLQKALPANTAYLGYVLGPDASCALWVSPDSVEGFVLPDAKALPVEDLVRRARGGNPAAAADQAALDELGKLLLAPLGDRLAVERIFISPDANLFGLPFEAARPDGSRLIDRCSAAYVLSAAHLVQALKRDRTPLAEVTSCCDGASCTRSAVLDSEPEGTGLSLCAPVELWLPNVMDSNLAFTGSAGQERVYFADFLNRALPRSYICFCLGGSWSANGIEGPELQALLESVSSGDLGAVRINLWQGECAAQDLTGPVEADPAAALAVIKRNAPDTGNVEWARDVVYLF